VKGVVFVISTCSQSIDSEACKRCQGRYCAKKVSLFEALDETQLKKVTDKIVQKNYEKNQMIFFEGDKSEKLYLINRGKVKIFKYNRDGREQILYILSEGDFIGDISLFKQIDLRFNAQAIDNVNICELTKPDLEEIIRENSEIALKMLQSSYSRIEKLESLVQSLSNKDIESRIAGLLLSFIQDFGEPSEDEIYLNLPLSREDLANYIGVTRETISRKLGSLQDEGILKLEGNKRIVILDLEALEEKYI
jgi:CRP/FNR family transcriptional regulator, anaerobic regulatory protein